MQLLTNHFKGKVELADEQEFGKSILYLDQSNNKLFKKVANQSKVWISHADHVTKITKDFIQIAHSDSLISAIAHLTEPIYGIQFHAKVTHSEFGKQIIENFLFTIANCTKDWSLDDFISNQIKEIKNKIQDKQVILGLSGGVDSSVAAAIISKAIGKQLTCIFVDTGLLRKNEAIDVMEIYKQNFKLNLEMIDASKHFFTALKGVKNAEDKRKIIDKQFIDVFITAARKFKTDDFLA